MNNRTIVRTQTGSVREDRLTFSSGSAVGFCFLLFLSASLSKSLIHEVTRLKNPRNDSEPSSREAVKTLVLNHKFFTPRSPVDP